jgi:hypothetical protein
MLHVASMASPTPRSLAALRPRELVLGGYTAAKSHQRGTVLPALFSEPLCHALRKLRFSDVAVLYACTFTFPNLNELVVDGTLNIIVFRMLLKVISKSLPALTSLTIAGDSSVTRLADIVAAAPHLQRLRVKMDNGKPIAHDDLRSLVVASQTLHLYDVPITLDCENLALLQTIAHRVRALQLIGTTIDLCECEYQLDGKSCPRHPRPTLDSYDRPCTRCIL